MSRTPDEIMADYSKYRGKCREAVEELLKERPELTAVRGYYFCPIWCRDEAHWWAVDAEGVIYDPTKLQFPSGGSGTYTPYDGNVACDECGNHIELDPDVIDRPVRKDGEKVYHEGRYIFCSHKCILRFVGL